MINVKGVQSKYQLSSLRQPKTKDEKEAYWNQEARYVCTFIFIDKIILLSKYKWKSLEIGFAKL